MSDRDPDPHRSILSFFGGSEHGRFPFRPNAAEWSATAPSLSSSEIVVGSSGEDDTGIASFKGLVLKAPRRVNLSVMVHLIFLIGNGYIRA